MTDSCLPIAMAIRRLNKRVLLRKFQSLPSDHVTASRLLFQGSLKCRSPRWDVLSPRNRLRLELVLIRLANTNWSLVLFKALR